MDNQLQVLQEKIKVNKFMIWLRTNLLASKTINIGGKKIKFYPLRVFISLLILILLLTFIIKPLLLLKAPIAVESVAFESGSGYSVNTYGNNLLLSNEQGVVSLSRKGNLSFKVSDEEAKPMIDIAGKYYLRTEPANGKKVNIFKKDKLINTIEAGRSIISAKINKQGYTAVASEESGYKGMVNVYNGKNKLLYTWHSGEGYITDIDISSNGRYLAIAQLMSDKESAYTRILFIDIRRGETINTPIRDDAFVSYLKFTENDTLIAISDKDFSGYSKKGKERFNTSLAGKNPSLFAVDDKFMGFLCTDGRGNSLVEIYKTKNGRQSGSYTANGQVRCFDILDNVIVLGEKKNVMRITPRGKCKRTVTLPHDVKSIGIFDDKSSVLAVSGTDANILRIK